MPTDHPVRLATWLLLALIVGALSFVTHTWAIGGFPFTGRVDPRTGTACLVVETDAGTSARPS